jgi:hypothetical protein
MNEPESKIMWGNKQKTPIAIGMGVFSFKGVVFV